MQISGGVFWSCSNQSPSTNYAPMKANHKQNGVKLYASVPNITVPTTSKPKE